MSTAEKIYPDHKPRKLNIVLASKENRRPKVESEIVYEYKKSFADLGINKILLDKIESLGYKEASPIQERSIPVLIAGRDLLGQAQTGSGKTAAFALPLLQKINAQSRNTQALILAPTRELSMQVAEAFKKYGTPYPEIKIQAVYGGQGMDTQIRGLKKGAHIVVGTPGRIMDHIRRKTLNLSNITTLVLDEADEMLNMGFVEDIEWILSHAPQEKQVALFSATMPAQIKKIAQTYLKNQVEVKIVEKTETGKNIAQFYWAVNGINKMDALSRLIEGEACDGVIVFVRTKQESLDVAEELARRNFSVSPLNGDMNQALREKTVAALKKGHLQIIVATDVAARGLDIERISHVINYDLPQNTETYIHRIGRTGRAGRSGTAIIFVPSKQLGKLKMIERQTHQVIKPIEMPTKEKLLQRKRDALRAKIEDVILTRNLKDQENLLLDFKTKHDLSHTDIAKALLFMMEK